ncbi:MAG: winged helix-turn-helix domain-containing protein [Planctomycetaceae bacterium]|nr:winged helix-turn-helix domain-containing protein [Planctomycetaceae bacterium]
MYLSSREICHYVKATYGVKYSVTGIKYLLHRLGFPYINYGTEAEVCAGQTFRMKLCLRETAQPAK